jgi:hypothetical protein
MMADYVLRLFHPIKTGGAFLADITEDAKGWRRSTRLQGGYWQGSFTVEGELADLQTWFYDRLGCHLVEVVGGQTTWEGLVYEVELTHRGVKRRRSLDLMQNAVRATYSMWEGHTALTDWQINSAAINRYGRKEELLSLTAMNQTAAQTQATTTLNGAAWPWPRAVGWEPESHDKTSLTVNVCGYVFCANWRYASQAFSWQDGTATIGLSAWITEIAAADLTEFLSLGWARANTLSVQKYITQPCRVWDHFNDLVKLGDSSGNLWRLYVGAGRRLYYEQAATAPALYLRRGELFTAAGAPAAVSPFTVLPCVVRDQEYPGTHTESGSLLSDPRDFLTDEVEVGADGRISLRTALWSEADLLESQAEARQRQLDWLRDYWDRAAELDLERRRAEWRATHPIWEPPPF